MHMSELPRRFEKSEIQRTDRGLTQDSAALWVDVPGILDDTHILESLRRRPAQYMSDRHYKKLERASAAFTNIGTGNQERYDKSTIHEASEKLKNLLKIFEADPERAHLADAMRGIIKESTELDIAIHHKQVTELGRIARGRTKLFVTGEELWTDYADRQFGFVAPYKGAVAMQFEDTYGVEPLVENKDGETGLLPVGVYLKGLYTVREVTTWEKKYMLDKYTDYTPAERVEMRQAWDVLEAESTQTNT